MFALSYEAGCRCRLSFMPALAGTHPLDVQAPSGLMESEMTGSTVPSAQGQSSLDSKSNGAFDKLSCMPDEGERTGTQQAVDWLMESDQPGSDGPTAHPLGSVDDADISASGSLPQEPYFSASAAGVAGILRREQQQAASTDRFLCLPAVQAVS